MQPYITQADTLKIRLSINVYVIREFMINKHLNAKIELGKFTGITWASQNQPPLVKISLAPTMRNIHELEQLYAGPHRPCPSDLVLHHNISEIFFHGHQNALYGS